MMCVCSLFMLAEILLVCISVTRIGGQQVRCSDVDPSSNSRSLPDLPVRDGADITDNLDNFQVITHTNLDIYTVPTAGCNGFVEAVEFCYSESDSTQFEVQKDTLTLLTLNKGNDSTFTVTNTMTIQSFPLQDRCSDHNFTSPPPVRYCCGRYNLNPIDLPQVFAITMYNPTTMRNLLIYEDRWVQDYNINIDAIPTVGDTIRPNHSTRNLAMFHLVIGTSTGTTHSSPRLNTEPTTPSMATPDLESRSPELSPSLTPSPTPTPTLTSTTSVVKGTTEDYYGQGKTNSEPELERNATPGQEEDTLPSPSPTALPVGQQVPQGQIFLGAVAGISAIAGVVITTVVLLLLFALIKWKGIGKLGLPDTVRKQTNIEAPPISTLKQSFSRKFESEVARNHNMRADTEQTQANMNMHTDTNLDTSDTDFQNDVEILANEAYGISYPTLQDDDLYENIDNLASFSTFSPEADNQLSITPHCEIIPVVPIDMLREEDILAAVGRTASAGARFSITGHQREEYMFNASLSDCEAVTCERSCVNTNYDDFAEDTEHCFTMDSTVSSSSLDRPSFFSSYRLQQQPQARFATTRSEMYRRTASYNHSDSVGLRQEQGCPVPMFRRRTATVSRMENCTPIGNSVFGTRRPLPGHVLRMQSVTALKHQSNASRHPSTDVTSNNSIARYRAATLYNSTLHPPTEEDSTEEVPYERTATHSRIQDEGTTQEHHYEYI